MAAYRLTLLRKEQEKARWLNSPNNYQKVHIYETGTNNPKIITKVCLKMKIFAKLKINIFLVGTRFFTIPKWYSCKNKCNKTI